MHTTTGNRTSTDIAPTLAVAENSAEAIRNAYRYYKGLDRRYSLAYFCKRAGIPSTGYLSDVISGKRLLHKKYWDALGEALDLGRLEMDYLELLLKVDHDPTLGSKPEIQEKIEVLRKSLMTRTLPMPPEVAGFFDALEVFCAFGLFQNAPTQDELVQYFGDQQRVALALNQLLELKLIESVVGDTARLRVVSDQVLFDEQEGGVSHLDFLKMSLRRAAEDVDYWFSRREESHFVSSIISVEETTYREKLAAQKKRFLEMQAELESGEADQLVRFNVQVYPIRK